MRLNTGSSRCFLGVNKHASGLHCESMQNQGNTCGTAMHNGLNQTKPFFARAAACPALVSVVDATTSRASVVRISAHAAWFRRVLFVICVAGPEKQNFRGHTACILFVLSKPWMIHPVAHEFCIVCLGNWSDHSMTGGFFRCDVADAAEKKRAVLASLGLCFRFLVALFSCPCALQGHANGFSKPVCRACLAGLNDSWDEKKVLPQNFDAFERRFGEQVVAARQATSAARVFKDWYLQNVIPLGLSSTSSTCSTSEGKLCRTEHCSSALDDPVVDLVIHVFDQIAQARQQVAWAVVAAFSQQALSDQRDNNGLAPAPGLDTSSLTGSRRNRIGQDDVTAEPFESKKPDVEKETKESETSASLRSVSATSVSSDVLRLRRICLVGAIEIAVVDLDRVSRSAAVLVQLYVDQATSRATRTLRRLFGDTSVGTDSARMPGPSFQTIGGATKHRGEKQESNGQGSEFDVDVMLGHAIEETAGGAWNNFARAFADASWGPRSDTLAALAEVALRNVERLLAVARTFRPVSPEARSLGNTLRNFTPSISDVAELDVLRSSSLENSDCQDPYRAQEPAGDHEASGGAQRSGMPDSTWRCFLCGEPNSTTSERCGLCCSPAGPGLSGHGNLLHASSQRDMSTTDPGAALFAEFARDSQFGSSFENSCETNCKDDETALLAQLVVHRGKVKQEQSARRSRNEAAQQAHDNVAAGIDATGGWYCSVCTFHNDASASRCTVCERGRRPTGNRRNRTSERRSPRRSSRLMP